MRALVLGVAAVTWIVTFAYIPASVLLLLHPAWSAVQVASAAAAVLATLIAWLDHRGFQYRIGYLQGSADRKEFDKYPLRSGR